MTLSEGAGLLPAIAETQQAACQFRLWLEEHSDDDIREPSALPGWSRAQVFAHLRGVSSALARQLAYAKRQEVIEMYDGGADGRNADIAKYAAQQKPQLLAELESSLASLAGAIDALTDADLDTKTAFRDGTVADVVKAAWRELVIHQADLLIGVSSSDWTAEFCLHLFSFLEARVPEKTRLVLQPIGAQPVTLSNGNTSGKSYVITGMLNDIAAWLAGRKPAGQIEAFAAADSVALPELSPWPSGVPAK